jgi:uncharacterized protein
MSHRKIAVAAVAVLMVGAPIASAHVTVNPDTAAAGSFSRFAVRVPSERPVAATTGVTIRLPKGLFFVNVQPKPGWKVSVTRAKLAKPVKVFDDEATDRVATITWSGGRIEPGQFDEFGFTALMPKTEGTVLTFPSLQTYSSGEVVRWIGASDADTPAPRVTVTAAEPEEGAAATPASGTTDQASGGSGDGGGKVNAALGLGIAGLVAGLAGLGIGLTRGRRAA